jgi:N-acetyl-anhydromuramyl-L-alanine amidase AmpD
MSTATEPISGDRVANGLAFSAVPGGNNSAGVPWSTVTVQFRNWRNRRFSITPEEVVSLDPATLAALDAGTLFDWRFQVQFSASLNNPQAVAAIEAGVNAQEAAQIALLSSELRYWGFEGDS